MADKTKDWELYEAGKRYNQRLEPNYYETVDANLDFFAGNQWRNLPDSDMPKPVFNILKRIIQFFVASLTSTRAKVHFEPMMYQKESPDPSRQEDANGAEIANRVVTALLNKLNIEFKVKEALFDAAITGDACAHFYFDMDKKPYGAMNPDIKGDICMELVDGTNVFFGNANNPSKSVQPYIGISGRDMVKNLQDEAKEHKKKDAQDDGDIESDQNYLFQAGQNSRIEVEGDESGKALYVIIYRMNKDTGTVWKSKSTENTYIYKDIDTGMSTYPIAWMNWEKQKNTYHGRAVATGLLPNQIFINRMFAMAMYHLMNTAFPKAVYNADVIDVWDNAVGSAIGVEGVPLEANLTNIAGYLQPGNMSPQIVQVIEMAMQHTKETLGVSDAGMGVVTNPKNTSAILAVQKAAAIPLENPKANMHEWVEDIGHIVLDMTGVYYGLRPIMGDDGQIQMYDFSKFKELWMDVTADVGESSYWSEIASGQTLDNLLQEQHIDFIQYLERQSNTVIPQKDELIAEIKERMQQQAAQQQQQQQEMMQQAQQQAAAQQAGPMQQAQQAVQQQARQDANNAHQAQQQHTRQMLQADQKFQHTAALKHLDIAGKLALANAQQQNKGVSK